MRMDAKKMFLAVCLTSQLLVQVPPGGDGQGSDELVELDGAVLRCRHVTILSLILTLFSSKTLKTKEANLEGSPWGKNWGQDWQVNG